MHTCTFKRILVLQSYLIAFGRVYIDHLKL